MRMLPDMAGRDNLWCHGSKKCRMKGYIYTKIEGDMLRNVNQKSFLVVAGQMEKRASYIVLQSHIVKQALDTC